MIDGRRGQDEMAGESMAAFIERRRRETAAGGRDAQAAAHGAFGKAIRRGQDLRLSQPSDLTAHGAGLIAQAKSNARTPKIAARRKHSVGHPGFAESLIPVWGSGREAVADFQEGDYLGAALNGALAGSDFFLAGDVAKAVGKGGLYAIKGPGNKAVKYAWKAARKQMGKKGPIGLPMLKPFQEGHHWLIPHNGWGKAVPDAIKHHPLNIKAMPTQAMHRRIHTAWKGDPRFGLFDRVRYGSPTWAKVAAGEAVARPAAVVEAHGKPK